MLDKLINILYYLFPYLENYVYKKKMLQKIEDVENNVLPLSYMDGYEKLTMEELEKLHSKTFEYKKLIEDKAKTSLFSVSIAITLIVSLVDLVFKIEYFRILSILLVIFAFTNMILAGKMAFDVIGNLNVFFELFPSEFHHKKRVKKEMLAYATENNVNYNIVRNNHVYLSYKSIFVSLVAIALVGILYIVGKSMTSVQPDKQTELLMQMNNHSAQTTKVLKEMTDTLNKMNANSVQTTKALDEMNDTLNKMNVQALNGLHQTDSIKELMKTLVEEIRKLQRETVLTQK